ncbi:MAG TPA: AI-2E family transporter, partial [Gammaproteobacteria bacterium]|nr:AI-2E family transporter [Gammaproteobacteria bacterium]
MFSNDRLLGQILLLSLLGACLWVLAPFMTALFWAAVLAFASWPLMQMLTRALKGNASLAAGLLTGGWVFIVAGPLVWLGFNIADYIRAGTELIKNLRVTGLPDAPEWLVDVPMVGDRLLELWQTVDEQGA